MRIEEIVHQLFTIAVGLELRGRKNTNPEKIVTKHQN